MAEANWEEIKRLAADFQKAQYSSTTQKLTERNCIEIVRKLIESKELEVVYTTDGKEYLTPQELGKEIREELEVKGGRVNLVDLQQAINVDLSHIQAKTSEIVQSDKSLNFVLGQLIDPSYLDRIAEEINDRLQEEGQITIADLTKTYDLPGDFLSDSVEDRLGKLIHGQRDDYNHDVIFTETFVARHKSRIRGAFSAITRPCPLSQILSLYNFPPRLFYSVLDELISTGRLAGSLSGGRQEQATYVPDLHTRSQDSYVDAFYQQNEYLEYNALKRIGISDPKQYIKKRFKDEKLVFLSTCCVGVSIQDHLEAAVEESLSSVGWIDVMPLLPSIFSESDANQLLTSCLKSRSDHLLLCDTVVVSHKLIDTCKSYFSELMEQKAIKDSKMNAVLFSDVNPPPSSAMAGDEGNTKEDRKSQRKQKAAAATKSGGGTQGREVKTKSTKKKYKPRGNREDDGSEDEQTVTSGGKQGKEKELEFMKVEEIQDILRTKLDDCKEEMLVEIAERLHRPLRKQYQSVAQSVFLQATGTTSASDRKKTHGALQEKLTGLWTNLKLYEKGTLLLNDETQVQVSRHLLRTICTDIANLALNAVASDNMMSVSEGELTSELRSKIVANLPDQMQAIMTKLTNSLNGKSVEEFCSHLDTVCSPQHLGILLRKPDKKKERQLVFSHRQSLMEQLRVETDAAMTLHLAVTLLFQLYTQCMVNIPGRCVPHLVTFLKEHVSAEDYNTLTLCQDLIIQKMKDPNAGTEELPNTVETVKQIALSGKRNQASEKTD